MYPWLHFLEDVTQNLLPRAFDKVRHNMMVGGA